MINIKTLSNRLQAIPEMGFHTNIAKLVYHTVFVFLTIGRYSITCSIDSIYCYARWQVHSITEKFLPILTVSESGHPIGQFWNVLFLSRRVQKYRAHS